MSKQIYTQEQIQELLNNPYVKGCTTKYITFTDDFKLKAIDLDNRGFYFKKIFKDFGFPDYIVNSQKPRQTIKNFRQKVKNKGLTGLVDSKKGRNKKEKIDFNKMSKEDQIEYLKTENLYLKELHKQIYGHYP